MFLFIPGLFQQSACFQLSFIMHLLARLLFVLWEHDRHRGGSLANFLAMKYVDRNRETYKFVVEMSFPLEV